MPSIPVFVINLDRRADRLETMRSRLEGIDFIRYAAADGMALTEKDLQNLSRTTYPMTASEQACIMSHLGVCKRAVDENLPHACVLEDDVILSEEFQKFITCDSWIPEGVELIKIETMMQRVWLSRRAVRASTRTLNRLRSFHAGTAGYIVSLDGARRMLDLLGDPDQAADGLIFKRAITTGELGRVLQLSPALCVQEFVYSNNFSPSDILDGRKGLRPEAWNRPGAMKKVVREICRPFRRGWENTRLFAEKRCVIPFG